ncbi:plasmid recombination protein [Pseudomonas sp. LS1212]|uniref:MobV family relaxase n=1 Tax=Pseudomonas sp. LS1212 TaxID=2972478 RepID=UPI00215B8471|nr:MobV family relaxase [Pseudomonas sp. LS1212]UVJ43486.1 plasmid recombination protein [Pseudomonas sp. LS1212]
MTYAILRTKKLKSFGAVARSARHTFREQPTPNADPELSQFNRGTGAKTTAKLVEALKKGLPEKLRAGSVLCIEYMISASPEAFKRHGGKLDDLGDGYFNDALRWLRKKHGKENVIATTVHLDERTPHLVAYVVPRTKDGRLSCRDFLGGPAKLKAMQSDFYEVCGKPCGLERGIEGSKAKHQELKQFYGALVGSGEAPKLEARDYAAAAIGIKTATWRKAEALAKSHSQAAAVAPTMKKSFASRQRALHKKAEQLSERLHVFEHKRLLLKQAESGLEVRANALVERERAVSASELNVLALETERDAFERRIEILEASQKNHKAPIRGLKYESSHTLG